MINSIHRSLSLFFEADSPSLVANPHGLWMDASPSTKLLLPLFETMTHAKALRMIFKVIHFEKKIVPKHSFEQFNLFCSATVANDHEFHFPSSMEKNATLPLIAQLHRKLNALIEGKASVSSLEKLLYDLQSGEKPSKEFGVLLDKLLLVHHEELLIKNDNRFKLSSLKKMFA